MKLIVWILVAVLIILHQDFWLWEDDSLVYGFLPIGLAYHIGISIAAAAVWLIACTFAWPEGVDDSSEESVESGGEA
ncbi:MAG: hypothetical protein ACI87E_001471 [Mariniblastus sp.]|jgi:hypothetical protein